MSVRIGVQPCGCMTYFNSDAMTRQAQRIEKRIERNGGEIIEVGSIDQVNRDPDFMPVECPHDPKGWGTPRKANR